MNKYNTNVNISNNTNNNTLVRIQFVRITIIIRTIIISLIIITFCFLSIESNILFLNKVSLFRILVESLYSV